MPFWPISMFTALLPTTIPMFRRGSGMITSPNVLLVEDEEIISIVIESILQDRGYRIDVCRNGMHAWEKLQAEPAAYDLVLLDWACPAWMASSCCV